ncbi:semaphorin-2A isoform X2 [Phthorimaea operculella]|nr:semaphorin-2A isoform X2 [Phthorimaea operculella]
MEKYIETSELGLLIISVNEADAGRYDCWLGGSLLCSYNITVDTHRYGEIYRDDVEIYRDDGEIHRDDRTRSGDDIPMMHGPLPAVLFKCSPPEKSNEYQKIYSNWCHEFEKYKSAMKTWERKQEQCSRLNDSNQNTHPNEIV